MKKGVNIKNNDYKKVIKNVYDAGIMIYATFVIGYDSDTTDTVKKLCEFSIENKFAIANFNPSESCNTLVTSRNIIPGSGKSGILLTYSSIGLLIQVSLLY